MSEENSDRPPAKPVRLRPKRPCPICGKPSVQRYFPFCSARCADIDLNRWLGGRYAIAAEEPADAEEPDDSGPTDGEAANRRRGS